MTRKHFKDMANRMKALRPHDANDTDPHDQFVTRLAYMEQWKCTVQSMADFCQSYNSEFDRVRFLSACGY